MRRLTADAESLRTEFAGHPEIQVLPLGYEPSDAYRLIFRLPGIALDSAGQPTIINLHQAVIQLVAGYPREKPIAVMETAIFHPNFGPNVGDEICIGDYWSPAQSLSDIVVTIGELIQYQRYNTRSPLNAVAARWVAQNEAIFPVGHVSLFQAEPNIQLGASQGYTAVPPTAVSLGPSTGWTNPT
jgi:ubiquitin-protein ligase